MAAESAVRPSGYDVSMLIMIDEALSGGHEAFAKMGDVRTFEGRSVGRADVAAADVLVVRSVTRVDRALLAGSRVRFVGTASSGLDHVDTGWLRAGGIAFASAAGANAPTVAEYVLAALLCLAERDGFDPRDRVLGVVGVGRIGRRVVDWGRALGMRVLGCDPPLQRQSGGAGYVDFAELASQADIVTLHVPLTRSDADPTCDMVDAAWLAHLKAGAIVINTSRGEVVREADLLAAIQSGDLGGVVLDVWRDEPHVNRALADRVAIATPHVAGHSAEARRRAVRMICEALAGFVEGRAPAGFHEPASRRGASGAAQVEAGRQDPAIRRSSQGVAAPQGVAAMAATGDWWREAGGIVRQVCDVAAMDEVFRRALPPSADRFDAIRAALGRGRREFGFCRIADGALSDEACGFLSSVGFQIARPRA